MIAAAANAIITLIVIVLAVVLCLVVRTTVSYLITKFKWRHEKNE